MYVLFQRANVCVERVAPAAVAAMAIEVCVLLFDVYALCYVDV